MQSSMKAIKIISGFILMVCFGLENTTQAQVQEWPKAFYCNQEGVIAINWIPTTTENFVKGLKEGYTITREKLVDGEVLESTIISPPRLPIILDSNKVFSVTTEKKQVFDALADLMNNPFKLVEDSTAQLGKDSLVNEKVFALVQSEAFYNYEFGVPLGLGILDSSAVMNTLYRYSLRFGNGTTVLAEFEVFNLDGVSSVFEPKPELIMTTNESLTGQLGATGQKSRKLAISARSFGDSILLRWAPTTPDFWLEGAKVGYTVTRQEVKEKWSRKDRKDSTLMREPSVPILSDFGDSIIFPIPKEYAVEKYFGQDSAAMAAYSALFQESQSNLSFMEASQYLENRFAMSLLACEQSFLAAKATGLGIVDRNVIPGKTYVYTVHSDAGDVFSIAMVTIKNNSQKDPEPWGVIAEDGEYNVRVLWRKKQSYSFFELERSEDNGKTFKKVHNKPLSFIGTDENTSPYAFYIDSVSEIGKTYDYRFYGINSFGLRSKPAVFRGRSRDLTPPKRPRIGSGVEINSDSIALAWSGDSVASDVKEYQILLSDSYDGDFNIIQKGVSPETRLFYWSPKEGINAESSHYFKVRCYDQELNFSESDPFFVAVTDTTPPLPPKGLTGSIDSLGYVTLLWDQNSEIDFLEYHVYRTPDTTMEWSRVNAIAYEKTFFLDTVEASSLNEFVYYGISAVDGFYQESDLSKVALKRIDVIPPVSPVLLACNLVNDDAFLRWSESNDLDGKRFVLERKGALDTTWTTLDSVSIFQTDYLDTTLEKGWEYKYRVIALDDDGNFSQPSGERGVRINIDEKELALDSLLVKFDTDNQAVELHWDFTNKFSYLFEKEMWFEVYRSKGADGLDLYDRVKEGTVFIDKGVKPGGSYTYSVRVRFETGDEGALFTPFEVQLD